MEGIALTRRNRAGDEPPRMICPASSCTSYGASLSPARPRRLPDDLAHQRRRQFFNHAIAIHQGGDPTQIQFVCLIGRPPRITPALAALSEMVRTLCAGAGFPDRCCGSGRRSLQRRDHVVRGVVDVEQRAVCPRSGFASTKASSTSMRGTISDRSGYRCHRGRTCRPAMHRIWLADL